MIDGGYMECRKIAVATAYSTRRDLRVYRFAREQQTAAAVLVLVEETSSGLKVRPPDPDAPRVFREYPLRTSGFLPVNLVVDGKFEPEQERGGLLMNDEDKSLLGEAFAAGVVAVRYAAEQKWRNAHWLAYATRPERGFAAENVEETAWWVEALGTFVQRLASAPIVECESQMLPAFAEHGPYANFIVPRLLVDASEDETDVERLWPLVAATKHLVPPTLELAKDWTSIAEGWHSLGAPVSLVSVETLADCVRADAETLDQLGVRVEEKQWLAAFVGECWSSRAGVKPSALESMMPNQNLRLCSPSELKRDLGVSESLKCICTTRPRAPEPGNAHSLTHAHRVFNVAKTISRANIGQSFLVTCCPIAARKCRSKQSSVVTGSTAGTHGSYCPVHAKPVPQGILDRLAGKPGALARVSYLQCRSQTRQSVADSRSSLRIKADHWVPGSSRAPLPKSCLPCSITVFWVFSLSSVSSRPQLSIST